MHKEWGKQKIKGVGGGVDGVWGEFNIIKTIFVEFITKQICLRNIRK